jgi:hypothetical protein
VNGSHIISNNFILFSLHNFFNLFNHSSSAANQIKSTFQFKLATFAATLAAPHSLYSSFSTFIKGTGASGLSLLTFQYVYLSSIISHNTTILCFSIVCFYQNSKEIF